MDKPKFCQICISSPCNCQQILVAYFNLLKKADDRVLRGEPSSTCTHPRVISAGVDKLNAHLRSAVSVDIIRTQAKLNGYSLERVFLKDRRPYIRVSNKSEQIHLKLGFEETDVSSIISNPNRFISWQSYSNFISNIIPKESMESLRITRLDLNIDFAIPFAQLIQKLDVKNKRASATFFDQSGSRTGQNIGKGEETYLIYDKGKKEKYSNEYTRIELRLTKSKLPTRTLVDLPNLLLTKDFFTGLIGVNAKFVDSLHSEEQSKRASTFKSTLERDGFYLAKKSMDKLRNFDRDFAKLIKIENWSLQPSEIFKSEILKFIQTQEVPKWMH